jgi:DNA-binding MarR family transcriptional regulator
MGKLELVSRRRDEKDRRNVLIQRTVKGALYLERLADTIGKSLREALVTLRMTKLDPRLHAIARTWPTLR